MRSILVVLLFCGVTSLVAQIPGYQGKRFVAEVAASGQMPANFYRIAWSDYKQAIRFVPRLQFEYVTGRKQSLVLGIEQQKVTFEADYQPFIEGDPFQGNGAIIKRNYAVTARQIGLEYRFFWSSAWCLAPLGKYVSVGLQHTMASNQDQFKTAHWIPTVGFGRQHIALNRFSIHYGAQAGMSLGRHLFSTPQPIDYDYNLEQYSQGLYRYQLDSALSKGFLFRVFIAVGSLF